MNSVTLSQALDEVWCIDRALKVARISSSARPKWIQWRTYVRALEYSLDRFFEGAS